MHMFIGAYVVVCVLVVQSFLLHSFLSTCYGRTVFYLLSLPHPRSRAWQIYGVSLAAWLFAILSHIS